MTDQEASALQANNGKKVCDDLVVKKIAMRSIPKREFERYLIKKAEKIVDDVYYGDGWQVSLSQERQEKLCDFSIVAVDVTLACKPEIFDAFLLTFRKNFLRGGG